MRSVVARSVARRHVASTLIAIVSFLAALGWLASVSATTEAPAAASSAPASPQASASSAAPDAKHPPPKVPQPIDFPHRRHAASAADGGMDINCLYCHAYARRSIVAGIPPLAKCMGCHKHIATDKPEIVKLTGYWQRGEPVPWKKVHDLPEFVYFSHERHVQRFVFQQGQPVQQVCGYCHGDVKTMGVAERQKKLTMGWCLACHKQFQQEPREHPLPARDWLVSPSDAPLVAGHAGTNTTPAGMPLLAGDAARSAGVGAGHAPANAPRDCWQCHK